MHNSPRFFVFLATFVGLTVGGCSSDHASADVMLARVSSQQAALANAKTHVSKFHPSGVKNLNCEADDDVEEGNLHGDGDADCQFMDTKTQKKVKVECTTTVGKGCKKQ